MKKEDLWIERRTWEWHTGETKTQRVQVRFTVEDLKRVEEIAASLGTSRVVSAAHPQSAGMWLNLQFGGFTILWYTVMWCSELWLQANARLARRGQSHAVEVYRLIARHTIDEQIAERCGQKVTAQQLILDYFS